MHLQRAFTLPFNDSRWLSKLLPLLPLTLLTLLPIFGLIALAVIMGWLLRLIRNVRQSIVQPLPEWRDLGQLVSSGADVLLVLILAHLPLVVVFVIAALLGGSIGPTFYGFLYNVMQLCCLVPLSLIYMLLAWVIIGMGVLDYSDSRRRSDLYRLRYNWDRARTHAGFVSNWLLRAVMVNVACGLLALIPIIGWVLAPILVWPAQGILLGELARLIDGRVPIKKER